MASKAQKVEIFSFCAVENTQYALKGQKSFQGVWRLLAKVMLIYRLFLK